MMPDTIVWDFLPINWQALSAIATFMAVCVALLYPLWRERRRLKVNANIMRIAAGEGGQVFFVAKEYSEGVVQSDPCVTVSFVNMGLRPITVNVWGATMNRRARREGSRRHMIFPPENPILPKTVSYSEHSVVYSKEPLSQLDKIARVYLIDSIGRYWYVPRRNVNKIRRNRKET